MGTMIMIGLISIFIIFSVIAFIGISIAYNKVFSRADYNEYNKDYYYTYHDLVKSRYPRIKLSIPSGKNKLTAFVYGQENEQGLIIISPGHRNCNDIYLTNIMYFVDNGWTVLCYDYTGSYNSEGNNLVGYIQGPVDLNAVLNYVEKDNRLNRLPVLLFGHSLGAYTSTSVLQYGHKSIKAAVAASGFDNPTEQWAYSVKRSTGILGNLLAPYAKIYMKVKFRNMSDFSAIDGINSTNAPILIIQGTTDEYYGNVSSIYQHRDRINNHNCTIRLMTENNHQGHYDYFLTDEALKYQAQVPDRKDNTGKIDKSLYMQLDPNIMDYINKFYMESLSK